MNFYSKYLLLFTIPFIAIFMAHAENQNADSPRFDQLSKGITLDMKKCLEKAKLTLSQQTTPLTSAELSSYYSSQLKATYYLFTGGLDEIHKFAFNPELSHLTKESEQQELFNYNSSLLTNQTLHYALELYALAYAQCIKDFGNQNHDCRKLITTKRAFVKALKKKFSTLHSPNHKKTE